MPTSPAELQQESINSIPSRAMYAEFVAPAPAAVGDLARVIIPTIDGGVHPYDVAWEPRVSATGAALLPAPAAQAAVLDDEDGDWYVVWWDPAGGVELPDGGGTGDVITQVFETAGSNPWVINHGLGRYPVGLETFDIDGLKVEGDVANPTLDQTTVTFSGSMPGKATYI